MMLMNSLKGHIRAAILIFDFRTTKIKFWEGLFFSAKCRLEGKPIAVSAVVNRVPYVLSFLSMVLFSKSVNFGDIADV